MSVPLVTHLVGVSEVSPGGETVTYWLDHPRVQEAACCPMRDMGRSAKMIESAFVGRAPARLEDCFLDEAMTACWHDHDGVSFYDRAEDAWLFIGYRWALCRADGAPLTEFRPLSPVRRRLAEVHIEVAVATDRWIARARGGGA